MISEMSLPKYFWKDPVNTVYHVLNRMVIRPIIVKMSYDLLKDENPNTFYFHIFGCKRFILNNSKEKLGKFKMTWKF